MFGGQRSHESQHKTSKKEKKSQNVVQIFRQGEEKILVASEAKWDAQLRGLLKLERLCQSLTAEVECQGERQEEKTLVVSKEGHAEDSARRLSEKNL